MVCRRCGGAGLPNVAVPLAFCTEFGQFFLLPHRVVPAHRQQRRSTTRVVPAHLRVLLGSHHHMGNKSRFPLLLGQRGSRRLRTAGRQLAVGWISVISTASS